MHREFAKKLIAKMKALHSKSPRYVPAQESDFPHLDLRSYGQYRAALEALGYRYLGDLESKTVSENTDSPMARTLIRSMVSADGETQSAHYQVRPNMNRLWENLLQGIFNFRLVAAPSSFLKNLQTRQIYDFISEVGAIHVVTTSAELAGKFSTPAAVDSVHMSDGTSLEAVRQAHMQRLAAAVARAGAVPTRLTSLDDTLAMGDRQRQLKHAHRAASGWITRDELLRFTNFNVALTDSIFEEVQAILQQTHEEHPS